MTLSLVEKRPLKEEHVVFFRVSVFETLLY